MRTAHIPLLALIIEDQQVTGSIPAHALQTYVVR